MGRQPCHECVETWKAYNRPTPCDKCLPPVLEINRPYLELYRLCSDQYIMGPGGAVGLNALAIDRMMDYKDVTLDEREDFLMKVKLVAAHVIKEARRAEESEAAKARNRGKASRRGR